MNDIIGGSIHVCLPPAAIRQVLNAKWGEPHPYKHLGVNEILVYAPQNEDEITVLKQLIITSYEDASTVRLHALIDGAISLCLISRASVKRNQVTLRTALSVPTVFLINISH